MTAGRQLRALISLRWQMVRSRRARVGLTVLLTGVLLLLVGAALVGWSLPARITAPAAVLMPTAFAGFAVLAITAPLAAGGGNELFPADQLVGYPIHPVTSFLVSLVVAPLNLAWLSQVIVLIALTTGVTSRGPGIPIAILTTCAYVLLVTVVGQGVAWAVVGVRQSRLGRWSVWAFATVVGAGVVVVVRLGHTAAVLDRLPTTAVVVTVLQGGQDSYLKWFRGVGELLAVTAVAWYLGGRVCDWALRRPGSGRRRGDRSVRRRKAAPTALRGLLATDRSSMWRTTSLRRGALVLIFLPAAAAAGLGVSWRSLIVLPGLVAAGTGLLFGVNAFCLDASGGVWLASLPHRPALAAASKAWVLVETCLIAVAAVVLGAALRMSTAPTAAEFTALGTSTACCTLWVVATCMRLSVTRPHRADLRGPRDTPAPPGSMAIYSARLATSTTLIGMIVSVGAYAGVWELSLLAGLPFALFATWSLLRTVNRFEQPQVRAMVVQTVASG
jgi:hypothetical protein